MARFQNALQLAFCLLSVLAIVRADVTIGTEFYLAFPCNGPNYMSSLVIVNSNPSSVSITIDSTLHDFSIMQRTVGANSALKIDFTDPHVVLGMQVCDLNLVSQQGFRVITNGKVALYVYQASNDANNYGFEYMVLPANMLSADYFGGYNQRYQAIIVAKQDGTQVTIGSQQISMKRLDVYFTDAVTPIRSNYPYAYILTSQPQTSLSNYMSYMSLPKNYVSTQISVSTDVNGASPLCHIWAAQNNTQVSVNGAVPVTVNMGTPYAATFSGGGTVTANNPIQVFSFNPFLGYGFYPDAFLSANVQFYTNIGNNTNQLLIVTPIDSTGNIMFDGMAIPALQYRRIPRSSYYYYIQTINGPASLHTLSITTLDDRFLAYVYLPSTSLVSSNYPVALNLASTS